jgi:hypothetical protein
VADKQTYDFFIGHAGANTAEAELLYDHLSPHARVYLDSKRLELGARWDISLPAALEGARISVFLVSTQSDQAYYESEEIAIAIQLSRDESKNHRVIPIYLDAESATNKPYGFARLHSLFLASPVELPGAAGRLLDTLARMQDLPAREPGTASPASSLPRAARHFVDRGRIMDDLRRALKSGGQTAVVGVRGMGGVGKTELALQLARELEAERPGSTLWVAAADRPLTAVLGEMAAALGVTPDPNWDAHTRARQVGEALRAAPRTVFLDDVRAEFDLRLALPPEPCACLVTSRLHNLPRLDTVFPLDVMTEAQALEMLAGMPAIAAAIAAEPDAAKRLCELAARHPLALELAGKRLAKQIQTAAHVQGGLHLQHFNENLRDRLRQLTHIGLTQKSSEWSVI